MVAVKIVARKARTASGASLGLNCYGFQCSDLDGAKHVRAFSTGFHGPGMTFQSEDVGLFAEGN